MIRMKDCLTRDESRILVLICILVFLGFSAKYIAVQNTSEYADENITEELADEKVDIRTADKSKLMSLPNIGEVKAEKILNYRREKQFDSTMELLQVKGIGPKTMDILIPWLVIFGENNETVVRDSLSSDGLIEINSASMQELMSLPDIGEVKAKRIIDRRENIGKYRSEEDLLEIKGIGKKTLAKLKPLIKCER